MPIWLYAELEKLATANNMTVSAYCRLVLYDAYQSQRRFPAAVTNSDITRIMQATEYRLKTGDHFVLNEDLSSAKMAAAMDQAIADAAQAVVKKKGKPAPPS